MLIPGPDTQVIEMRIPGSPGAVPEELVDATSAVDVAGSGADRLVRPADRLRRPAPGPVLQAGSRPTPRTVEGYLWGGLAARGLRMSAWLILLPFSLVNAALWMLPPVNEASRTSRLVRSVLTALLRLSGLALTVLLTGQLTVAGIVLIGGPLQLLPVLLVLLVVSLLSVTVRHEDSAGTPSQSQLVTAFSTPESPTVRTAHIVASLASIGLCVIAGPFPLLTTVVSVVLLGLAVVAVLSVEMLDRTTSWARRLPRYFCVATGLATAATAAFIGQPQAAAAGQLVDLTVAVLMASTLVFALVLIPAALLAQWRWSALPGEIRPLAGGWAAAPTVFLAWLLGFGLGAALTTAGQWLTGTDQPLPASYQAITAAWGAGVGYVGLVTIVLMLRLLLPHRPRASWPAELTLLHRDRSAEASAVARAWWLAEIKRTHLPRLAIAGVGLVLVAELGFALASSPDLLTAVGIAWLVTLAIALPVAGYLISKYPNALPYIGTLVQLICCWPRAAHPSTPPCYLAQAVPSLVNRVIEHLSEPGARVVLAGIGQGSVLAVAALTRLVEVVSANELARIGMVTAGSPVQWAYSRLFPAVVPHELLGELAEDLAGRWRALCRGTDPAGGAVTSWQRQICDNTLLGTGFQSTGVDGALPTAARAQDGGLILGGDHWLPDPQRGPQLGRRWRPGMLRHRDYLSDPEWDRAIALAAGLASLRSLNDDDSTGLSAKLSRMPSFRQQPAEAHSDSA